MNGGEGEWCDLRYRLMMPEEFEMRKKKKKSLMFITPINER
jgi:hypothetical protein